MRLACSSAIEDPVTAICVRDGSYHEVIGGGIVRVGTRFHARLSAGSVSHRITDSEDFAVRKERDVHLANAGRTGGPYADDTARDVFGLAEGIEHGIAGAGHPTVGRSCLGE